MTHIHTHAHTHTHTFKQDSKLMTHTNPQSENLAENRRSEESTQQAGWLQRLAPHGPPRKKPASKPEPKPVPTTVKFA